MVDADTQGSMVPLADVKQAHEALAQPLQFGGIFGIGIVDMDELAGGVHVVARVDAHFLHQCGGGVGHVGVEVDVGHKRGLNAFGPQLLPDEGEAFGFAAALRGETHQFAACGNDAAGLKDGRPDIVGIGVGHRLYAYRIVRAYRQAAGLCGRGQPS